MAFPSQRLPRRRFGLLRRLTAWEAFARIPPVQAPYVKAQFDLGVGNAQI
jgi:hypothetical protein